MVGDRSLLIPYLKLSQKAYKKERKRVKLEFSELENKEVSPFEGEAHLLNPQR